MQIPGAAENAHLNQRQRLTGRAAHAAIPCRPNAAQHFKSPGESPAACFKMQLLFCHCILRVLRGLCTVHPESFPAISEEFLCFRHIRSLCRQRKARSFRLNFPPDSGRTKKEACLSYPAAAPSPPPSKSDFSFTSLAPFKCPEIANHLRSCAADRRNPGSH